MSVILFDFYKVLVDMVLFEELIQFSDRLRKISTSHQYFWWRCSI